MKSKNQCLFLLLIILIFGFWVRIHKIDSIPPGFFCDEAGAAYDAHRLIKTGADMHGESWPILFKSFGSYGSPLFIYAAMPFIAVGGLNETTIRSVSVFFGLICIIFLFLIGREISSPRLGIWAALMGAVLPWFVHYQRTAFDFNSYPPLFLAIVYFLIRFIHKKSSPIPFFLSTAVGIYTCHSARLIVPLFFVSCFIFYFSLFFNNENRRQTNAGLILLFLLCLPMVYKLFSAEALIRFNEVSILRSNSSWPEILKRGLEQYFIQLTPSYFFTKGEPTFISRHFIDGLLPCLIITAPFLFIGIIRSLFFGPRNIRPIFWLWLIIYPISGFFVESGPFTSRSYIGAPLVALMTAIGFNDVLIIFKSYRMRFIVSTIFVVGVVANFFKFADYYINTYPKVSWNFWGWQFGAKDTISYFIKNQNQYDDFYMEPNYNAPDIFFKFYADGKCKNCQVGRLLEFFDPTKKQLFAVSPQYYEEHQLHKSNWNILDTIPSPDGTTAVLFVTKGP